MTKPKVDPLGEAIRELSERERIAHHNSIKAGSEYTEGFFRGRASAFSDALFFVREARRAQRKAKKERTR